MTASDDVDCVLAFPLPPSRPSLFSFLQAITHLSQLILLLDVDIDGSFEYLIIYNLSYGVSGLKR